MTKDKDFKRIVRDEAERTGEPYASVRARLTAGEQAGGPGPEAGSAVSNDGGQRQRFALRFEPGFPIVAGVRVGREVAPDGLIVEIDSATSVLRVVGGSPALFELEAPLDRISGAAEVADRWEEVGVTARGRSTWLLRFARSGTVEIRFDGPLDALYRPVLLQLRGALTGLGEAVSRPRGTKVTRLVLTLEDPAAFIAALDVPPLVDDRGGRDRPRSGRTTELGVAGSIEPELASRIGDDDVDALHSVGLAGPWTPELLRAVVELDAGSTVAAFHALGIAGAVTPDQLALLLAAGLEAVAEALRSAGENAPTPARAAAVAADLVSRP